MVYSGLKSSHGYANQMIEPEDSGLLQRGMFSCIFRPEMAHRESQKWNGKPKRISVQGGNCCSKLQT